MPYNLRSIGLSLMSNEGVKDDPFTSRPRGYPVPKTSRRPGSSASSSPNNRSARSLITRKATAPLSASHTTNSQFRYKVSKSQQGMLTSDIGQSTPLRPENATSQTYKSSRSLNISDISLDTSANADNASNEASSSDISGFRSSLRSNDIHTSTDTGYSTSAANLNSSSPQHVINLDESASDSLIFVREEVDSASDTDRSNNANTRQQSENMCKVLSCEAKFSSQSALGHHMNLFSHSPCNPFLKATDCKLSPDPLCYLCPHCDREFHSSLECSDHMKTEKHLPFYPPLSVAGYLCAQCLYVFESFTACWQHIEQASHRDICYPFADDLRCNGGGMGPIAVVRELVDDLVRQCQTVQFRVQCLECSLEIGSPASLRQHMLETNDQHIVSALCDSNLVDIFAGYLAGYSCDKCKRLFSGDLKNGAKHDCARGIIGTIREHDMRSFFDFIKRCGLTLVKSLVPQESPKKSQPQPGPSGLTKRKKTECDIPTGPASNLRSAGNPEEQVELLTSDEAETDDDNEDDVQEISDDDMDDCVIVGVNENDASSQINKTGASSSSTGKKKKKKKKKKKSKNQLAGSNDPVQNQISMPGQRPIGCNNAGPGNQAAENKSITGNQAGSQPRLYVPVHLPPPPLVSFTQAGLLPTPPFPLVPIMPLAASVNTFPPPLVSYTPLQQPQTRAQYSASNSSNMRGPTAPRNNQGDELLPLPGLLPLPTTNQCREKHRSVSPANKQADLGNKLQVPRQGSSRERQRSRSPINGKSADASTSREKSHSSFDSQLISTAHLSRQQNIIFLDLDNWCSFFSKLPRALPELTFVWGFYGGRIDWYEPHRCYVYDKMKSNGQFYLNEKCGTSKDAADFAIVLNVGKMDERLPSEVAFTILSGDTGFREVERQMERSKRKAVVINPHRAEQFSNEMIYTMVTSVTDT